MFQVTTTLTPTVYELVQQASGDGFVAAAVFRNVHAVFVDRVPEHPKRFFFFTFLHLNLACYQYSESVFVRIFNCRFNMQASTSCFPHKIIYQCR
jgi:hypothetical protein